MLNECGKLMPRCGDPGDSKVKSTYCRSKAMSDGSMTVDFDLVMAMIARLVHSMNVTKQSAMHVIASVP